LPEDATVTTDPLLLNRILQNLLSNALRYTVTGEIELRCALAESEIRFTVRDTGIGIPSEAQARVFEAYYRHPEAQQIERLGTGLGLTTVKQFCDLLGGTVSVESTPGVGSTFCVTIPRIIESH